MGRGFINTLLGEVLQVQAVLPKRAIHGLQGASPGRLPDHRLGWAWDADSLIGGRCYGQRTKIQEVVSRSWANGLTAAPSTSVNRLE